MVECGGCEEWRMGAARRRYISCECALQLFMLAWANRVWYRVFPSLSRGLDSPLLHKMLSRSATHLSIRSRPGEVTLLCAGAGIDDDGVQVELGTSARVYFSHLRIYCYT